jgi:phosphate-selective porin OprO and OprP
LKLTIRLITFLLSTLLISSTIHAEETKDDAALPPIIQLGKDGFILKSADQKFSIRFGGYVQGDSRFLVDDDSHAALDTFFLRRARPLIEATFYKSLTFRFLPDFGQGTTSIQEAYGECNYYPHAKVRVGKYKAPVGLERLQSATALLLVERGMPTNIVPNRDVGVQLAGDLKDALVTYAIAVMNGVPDGGSTDLDVNDGKDVAARIFFNPNAKASLLAGAGFGIAGTYGKQEKNLPNYKTPALATFFAYNLDSAADGTIYRVSPQFQFYNGPVSIISEYVLSSEEVRNPTRFSKIQNTAWQIAGGILLSGDRATPKPLDPKNTFDPGQGTWGAWQLAFRYSALDIDEDAFAFGFADPTKSARSAKEFAAGLNWYWNRNMKLVFNYDYTKFEGGAASGDRETENVFLSRLQLAF